MQSLAVSFKLLTNAFDSLRAIHDDGWILARDGRVVCDACPPLLLHHVRSTTTNPCRSQYSFTSHRAPLRNCRDAMAWASAWPHGNGPPPWPKVIPRGIGSRPAELVDFKCNPCAIRCRATLPSSWLFSSSSASSASFCFLPVLAPTQLCTVRFPRCNLCEHAPACAGPWPWQR